MSESSDLSTRRPSTIAFVYNETEVSFDEDRFIDLTQMWRAVGSPPSKKPAEWARQAAGAEFIRDLANSLKVGIAHLWKTKKGQGFTGGTWAHWQIALAYAKYLSNDFHRFVNEAFREWAEERANPDLKAQRAIEGYRRRGKDDKWILARLEGIVQRNQFTDTLKDHGVLGIGYARCSDAINREVLGGSAKEIKIARGLSARARTRDHLDMLELAAVRFAEAMAGTRVCDTCASGNVACCQVCQEAGSATHQAMVSMGLAARPA